MMFRKIKVYTNRSRQLFSEHRVQLYLMTVNQLIKSAFIVPWDCKLLAYLQINAMRNKTILKVGQEIYTMRNKTILKVGQ